MRHLKGIYIKVSLKWAIKMGPEYKFFMMESNTKGIF